MKWEYSVLNLEEMQKQFHDSFKSMLDVNGVEGWELVSVDNGIAYFKRPIVEPIAMFKLDFSYKGTYE